MVNLGSLFSPRTLHVLHLPRLFICDQLLLEEALFRLLPFFSPHVAILLLNHSPVTAPLNHISSANNGSSFAASHFSFSSASTNDVSWIPSSDTPHIFSESAPPPRSSSCGFRHSSGNFARNSHAYPPCVVLGLSGKPENLVEVEKAEEDRIPLIRRFTGGGTVLIDECSIISSLILPVYFTDTPSFPLPVMSWTISNFYAKGKLKMEENAEDNKADTKIEKDVEEKKETKGREKKEEAEEAGFSECAKNVQVHDEGEKANLFNIELLQNDYVVKLRQNERGTMSGSLSSSLPSLSSPPRKTPSLDSPSLSSGHIAGVHTPSEDQYAAADKREKTTEEEAPKAHLRKADSGGTEKDAGSWHMYKKVGGNAQSFSRQYLVHHTSFLWKVNKVLINRYLKNPVKQPKYRQLRQHDSFLCGIKDVYGNVFRNEDEFIHMIRRKAKNIAYEKGWGYKYITFSDGNNVQNDFYEIENMRSLQREEEALAKQKYVVNQDEQIISHKKKIDEKTAKNDHARCFSPGEMEKEKRRVKEEEQVDLIYGEKMHIYDNCDDKYEEIIKVNNLSFLKNIVNTFITKHENMRSTRFIDSSGAPMDDMHFKHLSRFL